MSTNAHRKPRPFDHGHDPLSRTDEELAEEIALLSAADEALTALGNRYAVVSFDIRLKLAERQSWQWARAFDLAFALVEVIV